MSLYSNFFHPQCISITFHVVFGGLVVIVFEIGPTFAGTNPVQGDGFLRALKIHSTLFFGGEIKPSAPRR
jgi:hypothetical protein